MNLPDVIKAVLLRCMQPLTVPGAMHGGKSERGGDVEGL